MSSILKISEAASLAIHTMAYLARHSDRLVSTHEVSEKLYASENHLSKVLQRLNRAGLLESVRGPNGGYRLARDIKEITLLAIYETVEGPIPSSACLLSNPAACFGEECLLGGLLDSVSQQVKAYLQKTTLDKTIKVERSKK